MRKLSGNSFIFIIFIAIMIYNSLTSGRFSDPRQWLIDTLIRLPAIIIGLTFHEFMHAFTAYKLGDQTPYGQGRVTLNPVKHIDPVGIIALIFIGFGWGRPVMVNPYAFRKNPRLANLLVDVAGVFINFIIALVFMLVLLLVYKDILVVAAAYPDIPFINLLFLISPGPLYTILLYIIYINLVLMLFNLLPIPPLDGFGILTEIFNLRRFSWYRPFYNNGSILLLVLIIFGGVGFVLGPGINGMIGFIGKLWIAVLT